MSKTIIIIGAGLAGLSAALQAAEDVYKRQFPNSYGNVLCNIERSRHVLQM